jgi:hypothetical protein
MLSEHPPLVSDTTGRSWTPGPVLGRGTWGRSRLVHDDAGREAVLKEPLTADDFPADAPLPEDLLAGCTRAAREQADLLGQGSQPFLPKLESTVELGDGRVGVVLPRYATTLQRRLDQGLPLGDALRIVHRIALALAEANAVHGNLRPSNVLFGERGEIWLADMVTTPRAHGARLLEEAGVRPWSPPEATATRAPVGRWDTWALCQVLFSVVMDGSTAEPGLDKLTASALKDRVHTRLAAEGSNPRFRARVADRMGALLLRGLSAEIEPSPPYRFSTAKELADRVFEILALLRPRVADVGRIMFPGNARDGVYQGGQPVTLSVTVGCSPGVADSDDLVCGLQLVDLDAPHDGRRPIDDARITVAVHPSGRLRFQLAIPERAPGRYRIKVAFAVKDSGDEPQVAEAEIAVRPPPGYVPPPKDDPAPSPLPFPAERAVAAAAADPPATTPSAATDQPSDPLMDPRVVPLAPHAWPRPVAPPDDEPVEDPKATPVVIPSGRPSDRETEPSETPLAPLITPRPTLRAVPDLSEDVYDEGSSDGLSLSGPRPALHVTPAVPPRVAVRAPPPEFPIQGDSASDVGPLDAAEDLPSWGDDRPFSSFNWAGSAVGKPVDQLVAFVRRDTFAAIGLCVMVVLALTLLLRAC